MSVFDDWSKPAVHPKEVFMGDGKKYVKAEEAEAIEQLNKEMLEVLKECLPEVRFNYHSCVVLGASEEDVLMQRKRKLIAKTESIIAQSEESMTQEKLEALK